MEELGAKQPAPRNHDSPVILIRTTCNRIGGFLQGRQFRRDPLTISAGGAAVLIGVTSEAARGAKTSFAMYNSQQSKINDEITKLVTLVCQLNIINQTQCSSQNNINLDLLQDREEFSHRIETALCSADETHTQNERLLEMSNLCI